MEKKSAIVKAMLPSTKVVVSCRDSEGKDNALVVGFCCNCSFDPPMLMVGIVPSRHSHHMIKETGCFVVNLPRKDQKDQVSYLGSHSGRDGDKLAHLGMGVKDGTQVAAPLLLDCPVNIECEVVNSIVTGSHEMFVGKILCIHADRDLIDEKGAIDLRKADLL